MAAVMVFRQFVLPWTRLEEEDSLLKKITLPVVIVCLVLSLIIPFIPVPEKDLSKTEKLPPRLAQLVLEKQKPKPEPPKVEKKEEKKEEKKKEEKKKEEKPKEEKPKEEPKVEKVPEIDRVAEARKKAASSGLLAFSDELADLRETPVAAKLGNNQPLSKGVQQAQPVKRDILTSGNAGSGGIDTSRLGSGVGRSSLAGRQTTQVESPVEMVAKAPQQQPAKAEGAKPSRTYEEVSLVFDKNKGAIYSLYSRALRQDPTLQGKVVLEITIDATGRVTECKIVSSELNNPDLENKLIARVKLLNFGERNVEVMVVTYPIDFLPS